MGPVPRSTEHDDKPSGYVKSWEFLDQLNDCQLLKNYSVLCN